MYRTIGNCLLVATLCFACSNMSNDRTATPSGFP